MTKISCLLVLCLMDWSATLTAYHFFDNHHVKAQLYTAESYSKAIKLVGTTEQKQHLLLWLDAIATTQKGQQTLSAIIYSGHILTIRHSENARLSAGKTIAPMTENLINGKGESVTIAFYSNMPSNGTHKVYDNMGQAIEFTAVQNLYHELAHAMHKMQGTWRYFASEKQAIEEENIFRKQLARVTGEKVTQRFGKKGTLIEHAKLSSTTPKRSFVPYQL